MIKKLVQPIDNAQLILFRIFFGFVFLCESIGSLLTGWAKTNFANVSTNFTFIGFEWLEHIANDSIYYIFIAMAFCSINIILGAYYRISVFALIILWGMVYFGQKTSYNNHYYLMWLITFIMFFVPAQVYASWDAKKNPTIQSLVAPRWSVLIFPIMISIVYFYATVAKFYPDWLDGTVTKGMFESMNKPDFLKPLFHNHTFHLFIAYMGIVFDGLIIPALLSKRTRWFAIIASLIFHIFNSITLQIGVFPYFALAFCIFFFPAESIRAFFFKKKPKISDDVKVNFQCKEKVLIYIILPFIALQILLPIRHWFIAGDVLFTEEGHRLAWRMMLRSRQGEAIFTVKDLKTGEHFVFENAILLTNKQQNRLNTPDVIWQMAQKIKSHYKKQGKEVAVYCTQSKIMINRKSHSQLIDPTVDLASQPWHWYKHEPWIVEAISSNTPSMPKIR